MPRRTGRQLLRLRGWKQEEKWTSDRGCPTVNSQGHWNIQTIYFQTIQMEASHGEGLLLWVHFKLCVFGVEAGFLNAQKQAMYEVFSHDFRAFVVFRFQ